MVKVEIEKMHKCAILQSNYIPWKGVFDMINLVDTFVFLDDVDYTKRDWRTRNQIKTSNGLVLLTIPVVKATRGTKIYEITIANNDNWQIKHYTSIYNSYKKATYFKTYAWVLEKIYLEQVWVNLSEFNTYVTKLLCEVLDIKTKFINSVDLKTDGQKDDKLIDICTCIGANSYLSGPSAKNYIVPEKFVDAGIQLEYMSYDYPEYRQLYGEFCHFVTVLDVVFNCGADAGSYIFSNNWSIQ